MFTKNAIYFILILSGYYVTNADSSNIIKKNHPYSKYVVAILNREFDVAGMRQVGDLFYCTGVIVAPKTILTTASCLQLSRTKKPIVIAGTHAKKIQILHGNDTTIHPEYRQKNFFTVFDIALIHLSKKLKENNAVAHAKLLSDHSYTEAGSKCTHIGWGRMTQQGQLKSDIPYNSIVVLKKQQCDKHLTPIENTFCASPGARDCLGSEGLAIFCNGVLAGLSIQKSPCMDSIVYFTNVSHYIDWIQNATLKPSTSSAGKQLSDNIYREILRIMVIIIRYFVKI